MHAVGDGAVGGEEGYDEAKVLEARTQSSALRISSDRSSPVVHSCRARSRSYCCWAEEGQEEELVDALVAFAVGSKEGQEVTSGPHVVPLVPVPNHPLVAQQRGDQEVWTDRRHAWIEGAESEGRKRSIVARARSLAKEGQKKGLKDACYN
jgi:hypothetical protein